MTGNREWPVSLARATTSAAVSPASSISSRIRSVITSTAVSEPIPIDRVSSAAVPTSRVPASAEWRTSEASSEADRAPLSSSRGSMPKRRRIALAEELRPLITGRRAVVNPRCTGVIRSATRIGSAIAQFFGISSPKTIENVLTTTRLATTAIAVAADCATDAETRPAPSRFAIADCIV